MNKTNIKPVLLDEFIRTLERIREDYGGKVIVRFEPNEGYFSPPHVGTGRLGGSMGAHYVYIQPRD